MPAPIPIFALYGEQDGGLPLDPVHVETIYARSHLHDWAIRPHRHADLHQLFWVRRGGGVMALEGAERYFSGPRLFVVPPGLVHGFRFQERTRGHVLTITAGFLAGQRAVLGSPGRLEQVADLGASALGRLERPIATAFRQLEREFARGGAGRPAASPQAALVARFRAVIETDFRERVTLEGYGGKLGVTTGKLTRACRRATGRSPLDLLQDRRMLEAVRLLTYTAMSIAEVAYSTGFADPAYFSRFFQKRAGMPPSALREDRGG